jgi:hypothetical protein
MPILSNPHHETFAQARFAGKTLAEAHESAGLSGDKATASRLSGTTEVQERIAELYRERATETMYDKASAVRDLLTVIHTPPSEAIDDHPLCEVRMGKNGPYHRFPPKLQAMSRLIKIMAWDQPPEPKEPRDSLTEWIRRIRESDSPQPSCPPPPTFEPPEESSSSSGEQHPSINHSTHPPSDPPHPPTHQSNYLLISAPCSPSPAGSLSASPPLPLSASSSTPPLPPKQEAFANSRVQGLGVMAAYQAAGFTGGAPHLAWRINNHPPVQARIAKLNGGVETLTGYRRDDLVRDLISIIRARPSEATEDHPLCETRMTAWGLYYRFPSKLVALLLLSRLHRWHEAPLVPHDPDANLNAFLARIRSSE